MVSGLTPPSKRKDKLDLRDDINELREIVRTGASTTGISAISGGTMAGDTPMTASSAIGGLFSLQPEVCFQSVIVKYEENNANTKRLEIGGIIQSSLGGSNKWEGQLLFFLDDEADGDVFKKVGVFEPSNPKQLTFTNSAQDFIEIDTDGSTVSGWTADFITGDLNEFNDKVLPIKSSTSIVESAGGGNAEVQWIKGSVSNGQIISLKPKEGKTLTLKSGGNIDIDSDLTIDDNEFAYLQMFWDANHAIKFVGGGGEGARAVAYVEDDDGSSTTATTGRIQSVLVTHNGIGYTSNPTVTVVGGTGSGATFSPLVTGGEVVSVTVNAKGSGYEQTGRFLLVKTGSSGGVQVGDSPTWTGTHIWNGGGTAKFQGSGVDQAESVLEIGGFGDHSVKFIAEITGEGGATISNPDGGSPITIPESDPSISVKASVVMNTYTMYDLDTLVFSQAESTQTPAPENDWVWIEADTGTGETPSLTGMKYNVPSNKTHQFGVNGNSIVEVDGSGLKFQRYYQSPSNSDTAIYRDTSDFMVFNVAENEKFKFQENGQQKMLLSEAQMDVSVPIFLDSNVNDAFIDFDNETSSAVGQPSGSHIRLFCDSGNSDHMSIRRDSTVVDLEGGGGVEASDEITWTDSHVFNDIVKFHKDGGDNDYDNNTVAGVEIGYDGNDKCLFNGWITGNGGASITNPDGGSSSYPLSSTENSINCHSSLVMNTYSIWDLDQIVFSVGSSTTNPNMLNDWWGIEVEHYNSTSNGHSYRGLNYYVPNGRKHVFLQQDKSVLQIGDEILYMNADEYNTIQFKGVSGAYGGLDISVNDSSYTTQVIDFFVQGGSNSDSYVFQINKNGVKYASGKYPEWVTRYSGSSRGGGGGTTIYPDKWVRVWAGGQAMYLPLYF